jgi:flavin reductase (DIM6/NTAB) family NADH-FMN oxidoreductase RutF
MDLNSAFEDLGIVMSRISKGAFLTVRSLVGLNTMTIGWGQVGVIWNRPIFTVMVRPTRHTFGLMEKAADFSVTVPLDESQKGALSVCGTKSGRDIDKFKEARLVTQPGRSVTSPLVKCNARQYECKIVQAVQIDKNRLAPELMSNYPGLDFHWLYFGEIVESYMTK